MLALLGLILSGVFQPPSDHNRLARDIFKELIEINTTDSVGDNTKAAEAMAARLRAAGLPADDIKVLAPAPRKGNLVARLRGTGKAKPILLLAHLDVVEARREDWSMDPFTFVEKDGFFYGRGTSDDKAMAAIFVANVIRYKQEGLTPSRDIILALTADEEGGSHNGVDWLLQNHRALLDADFALNEGGDGQIKNGKHLLNEVQASEKMYLDFTLEVTNPGGHSSLPVKENAIYRLAQGLTRLGAFQFPAKTNEVTRGFFSKMSAFEKGETAADMKAVAGATPDAEAAARLSAASPLYNSMLRTTCVATMLNGGHAANALPQMARANVNCRILPGEDPAEVRKTIATAIADDEITIAPVGQPRPSDPSPLRKDVIGPIEQLTASMWPGVPIVPTMSTGATDGLYLRNAGIPTYGVSGIFADVDDIRAHGRDERIGVKEFYQGQEFLYRLVKTLAQ
jgi:acetylornithine deacetylase/succinyl-diaminopimelate desuccinylase-like protein